MKKKKILIFTAYFVPAYKAGGPTRSISTLVDALSDECHFYIATGDRDYEDNEPFKNVRILQWNDTRYGKVFYAPWKWYQSKNVLSLTTYVKADVIYLNSFFNVRFAILPFLINKVVERKEIVIAPRGEFSKGALNIKKLKKKFYITLFKLLNFKKDILWHATSDEEFHDIKKVISKNEKISIASNIPDLGEDFSKDKWQKKTIGTINIVYLSRVSPKKNLLYCFDILTSIKWNLEIKFDIYGIIDNEKYFEKIKKRMSQMPKNIKVKFCGAVHHEKVISTLQMYDLFFLPTLGENYCHAIFEAFFAGLPVLVSDQTPWRELKENGVGWDLALEKKDEFVKAVYEIASLDNVGMNLIREKAHLFAVNSLNLKSIIKDYKKLFM